MPTLPHEVQSAEAGQDLGSYIASECATLYELLTPHAAILLRRFDVPAPESFVIACRQLSPNLVDCFGVGVGGGELSKRVSGRWSTVPRSAPSTGTTRRTNSKESIRFSLPSHVGLATSCSATTSGSPMAAAPSPEASAGDAA